MTIWNLEKIYKSFDLFIIQLWHKKVKMQFLNCLVPFILLLIHAVKTVIHSRNQGCSLLILVDQSFFEVGGLIDTCNWSWKFIILLCNLVNNDEAKLRGKVDVYIKQLNSIYKDTILKSPPNNKVYFYVKDLIILKNYIPSCNNKGVNYLKWFKIIIYFLHYIRVIFGYVY